MEDEEEEKERERENKRSRDKVTGRGTVEEKAIWNKGRRERKKRM